jgi:ABC-type spermidine/putrescine transport system permease subunit II
MIILAHVMFCISFVVVAVKARISLTRLEQAAADLHERAAGVPGG